MTQFVNRPVEITAVRFTKEFETIPRRIELDGISYVLGEDYKKVTLTTDEGTAELFDVSDGTRWFRLRQQLNSPIWQLLTIKL